MTTPQPIVIFLNPRAAQDEFLREAVYHLRALGHDILVHALWEPGEAERWAARSVEEGARAVIAAGGDGTLNEVVNGVLNSAHPDCAVGVLPYGTGNDFARAIGLQDDAPSEDLKLLCEIDPVPIDVGRINDRLFVNSATGGLAAEITTGTPPSLKRLLGGASYHVSGFMKLFQEVPFEAHLVSDDFEWRGPLAGLCVQNGRTSGGGFEVAYDARIDDGLLDVLVIPDMPFEERFAAVARILNHREINNPAILYKKLPWIEVHTPGGLQVNADGEPMRSDLFRFEVFPHALRFLVPATCECLSATKEHESATP
ncbi:MAG: YegS/Rv2252/BmrU family lipid kinase [Sumerlaeia bacterium]